MKYNKKIAFLPLALAILITGCSNKDDNKSLTESGMKCGAGKCGMGK